MNQTLTVQEKLSKAKINAVRDFPFFGLLVMSCEFVEAPGCTTMWADGRRIGYDPVFVENCKPEELAWAIIHEAMHNAFGHIVRAGSRHPVIHNYATDYWINGRLRVAIEEKQGHRGNGQALSIQEVDLARVLDDPNTKILVDVPRWGEMSSDEIYAVLIKELLPNGGGKDADPLGQCDGKGMGGDLNWEEAKAQGNDTATKSKENAEFWKGQIANAAAVARKQGSVPTGFDRFIDELLNPTVPWQEVLQHYVQPKPADYDFLKPDRRFAGANFFLPDFTGEMLKVVVAVDTSGSVSPKELTQYISDTCYILRSFETVEGWFIGCDAQVHDFVKIGPEDPVPSKIGGGGGTSFIPVFNKIEQEELDAHVLVYFTDGYGSFPAAAPDGYEVVWIVVNSNVEPPFGHVIHVQSN